MKEQFEQVVFPFDRDMVTTVELFDYLKFEKRMRVTREREIANAIELIGGSKKPGCPVEGVGKSVTIWIIREYDKYKIILQKNWVKFMCCFIAMLEIRNENECRFKQSNRLNI